MFRPLFCRSRACRTAIANAVPPNMWPGYSEMHVTVTRTTAGTVPLTQSVRRSVRNNSLAPCLSLCLVRAVSMWPEMRCSWANLQRPASHLPIKLERPRYGRCRGTEEGAEHAAGSQSPAGDAARSGAPRVHGRGTAPISGRRAAGRRGTGAGPCAAGKSEGPRAALLLGWGVARSAFSSPLSSSTSVARPRHPVALALRPLPFSPRLRKLLRVKMFTLSLVASAVSRPYLGSSKEGADKLVRSCDHRFCSSPPSRLRSRPRRRPLRRPLSGTSPSVETPRPTVAWSSSRRQ